jgi:RNA polymerase sigma factor (sigma-70 family)
MSNNHNVEGRPASFDAKLMKYQPGLLKLAGKFTTTSEERHDLVTDTIIYCLRNWQSFREDGGFWNWLYWSMRGVVGNKKEGVKARITLVQDSDGVFAATRGIAPSQLDYVELCQTMRSMSARGGGVVVRRAMGDTLPEIGAAIGVTAERVRQIENKERGRLLKRRAA